MVTLSRGLKKKTGEYKQAWTREDPKSAIRRLEQSLEDPSIPVTPADIGCHVFK